MKQFYYTLISCIAVATISFFGLMSITPDYLSYEIADNVIIGILGVFIIVIIQSYQKSKKAIKEKQQKDFWENKAKEKKS